MAAKKLGELLIDRGLVTQGQLGDALQAQMVFGGRLGTNLVELGYLSEGQLAKFLSTQLGLPSVSAAEIDAVSKEVLKSVGAETASKYLIFPLALSGRRLRLAMVDPTDLTAIDEIGFRTGFTIQPAVAPEVLIIYALEKHYEVPRPTRYLRLDRSTEAQMVEAHRAGIAPPSPGIAARPRPAPQSEGSHPGIRLGEPEEETGAVIEAVAAQLIQATEHSQALDIFRDALWDDFGRVAIFGINGAMAVGWLQAGLEGSDEDFRRLSFLLEEGLDITRILRGRVPCPAQIGDSPSEKWLLQAMGASPEQQVLFLPVSMGDNLLLFAVCDALRVGQISKSLGKYVRLSRKMAAALQMLSYRQQILAG